MTSTTRRIGVLTSGGDAPGLNAVLRAIVKTATIEYGWEVVGIEAGFEGLLTPTHIRPLGMPQVRGILPLGGTILGTTNKGRFALIERDGRLCRNEASYEELARNAREEGIDALVVLGGDGSQGIASHLADFGVRAIGVPKTIDNDLFGCDRTFGFDTALSVATEAIDRLHTTAASHDRVMVLEVMGRDAGWIALHAGVGGGADVILVPELPFSLDAVAAKVADRDAAGAKFSIIVVAEGANEKGGHRFYQAATGTLGGIGHHVAAGIAKLTGKECRVVVLGHLQRGGTPTPYDRILATRYGAAAVRFLAEGRESQVAVLQGAEITTIPMSACAGVVRAISPGDEMVRTARGIGIAFGDEAFQAGEAG
jgi:ATP-dependent phosphofructokinase / diphosphate-dependent phosphofructokinase